MRISFDIFCYSPTTVNSFEPFLLFFPLFQEKPLQNPRRLMKRKRPRGSPPSRFLSGSAAQTTPPDHYTFTCKLPKISPHLKNKKIKGCPPSTLETLSNPGTTHIICLNGHRPKALSASLYSILLEQHQQDDVKHVIGTELLIQFIFQAAISVLRQYHLSHG